MATTVNTITTCYMCEQTAYLDGGNVAEGRALPALRTRSFLKPKPATFAYVIKSCTTKLGLQQQRQQDWFLPGNESICVRLNWRPSKRPPSLPSARPTGSLRGLTGDGSRLQWRQVGGVANWRSQFVQWQASKGASPELGYQLRSGSAASISRLGYYEL